MAFPADWLNSEKLVIPASKISAALTGFPVYLTHLNLPSWMFDALGTENAQNGGGDIRFTLDAAGTTQLPCEVVSFTTANNPPDGRAQIWVRLPNVSATANTEFYVWWNTAATETQPAVTDPYGRNAVWDGFAAAYHLGAASGYTDVTGNGHTLSVGEGLAPSNGVMGNALPCSVFTGDGSLALAGTFGTLFDDGASYTLMTWFRRAVTVDTLKMIFHPRTDRDILWYTYGNSIEYNVYRTSPDDQYLTAPTVQDTDHFLVSGYDQSANERFLGLGKAARQTASGHASQDAPDGQSTVGGQKLSAWQTASRWNGRLAELRVYEGAPSKAWTDAAYDNQNDPATFVQPELGVTSGIRFDAALTAGGFRVFALQSAALLSTNIRFDVQGAGSVVFFAEQDSFVEDKIVGSTTLTMTPAATFKENYFMPSYIPLYLYTQASKLEYTEAEENVLRGSVTLSLIPAASNFSSTPDDFTLAGSVQVSLTPAATMNLLTSQPLRAGTLDGTLAPIQGSFDGTHETGYVASGQIYIGVSG